MDSPTDTDMERPPKYIMWSKKNKMEHSSVYGMPLVRTE